MVSSFRSRNGFPTQNVLAVVDFDLNFTYVLAGWEESAHDSMVLRDALQRPNDLKVPQGKCFLVDAGYATRPGFIAPFRGVRYHLKEFGSHIHETPKELFNHRYSSAWTSVERAFGSLKSQYKILTSRPFFPYSTQVDLVIACCNLHNIIIRHGGDRLIPSEGEWEQEMRVHTSRRGQHEDVRE
ncbi:protein ALP1-like [Dioscorea cayenensis subsp. rotundata]|uniref:Protein ALP1-like n=1 Tax=Dioscorea cayennensis subsp. rotundata TaxID=55577 RepID=A0AB40C3G3_DIOCR|nr:protein ALP1-like [Dioscorea cayenensis subsp. rotundata]